MKNPVGKNERNHWLFQIMLDAIPESWKYMIEEGIAAQQYPPGWINEIQNIKKLQELKSGDFIVAAFKNHRFGGYGLLTSDFYRNGQPLNTRTNEGELFEFKERFNCDWTVIPPIEENIL